LNWPRWYKSTIQYGLPVWFREAPKQWRRPQGAGRSEAEHEQMVAKLPQGQRETICGAR
jgi:hypothetical protein